MVTLPLLDEAEVRHARSLLRSGAWVDGRDTAGPQAAAVKNNRQLDTGSAECHELQGLVLRALDRSPRFLAAALPKRVFPPRFNRYGGSTHFYGPHVDSAIRVVQGARVRTDLACTLFLCDPAEYDGGELVLGECDQARRVKLAAGEMVLYPATSVHEVTPVTRGERLAAFFWIESMVRSSEQRALLLQLDDALTGIRATTGENVHTVALAGTYHNLLRMWADT